ncbi:MAG: hypothetical protein U9M97_03940 [Candidatus Hadarchaeota archaeon]|nr:hypothetical protein [Candidatus Hadarchaeota archaeon]
MEAKVVATIALATKSLSVSNWRDKINVVIATGIAACSSEDSNAKSPKLEASEIKRTVTGNNASLSELRIAISPKCPPSFASHRKAPIEISATGDALDAIISNKFENGKGSRAHENRTPRMTPHISGTLKTQNFVLVSTPE